MSNLIKLAFCLIVFCLSSISAQTPSNSPVKERGEGQQVVTVSPIQGEGEEISESRSRERERDPDTNLIMSKLGVLFDFSGDACDALESLGVSEEDIAAIGLLQTAMLRKPVECSTPQRQQAGESLLLQYYTPERLDALADKFSVEFLEGLENALSLLKYRYPLAVPSHKIRDEEGNPLLFSPAVRYATLGESDMGADMDRVRAPQKFLGDLFRHVHPVDLFIDDSDLPETPEERREKS